MTIATAIICAGSMTFTGLVIIAWQIESASKRLAAYFRGDGP